MLLLIMQPLCAYREETWPQIICEEWRLSVNYIFFEYSQMCTWGNVVRKKIPELGDEIAKSYNLLAISSFVTLSFIIILGIWSTPVTIQNRTCTKIILENMSVRLSSGAPVSAIQSWWKYLQHGFIWSGLFWIHMTVPRVIYATIKPSIKPLLCSLHSEPWNLVSFYLIFYPSCSPQLNPWIPVYKIAVICT